MFAEEKPALLPLPLEPFRYYQHGKRVVHPDGCIEVESAYYSLPPGRIGQEVQAQWDELFVRILDPKTGKLLREHVRQKRGLHRFKEEDRPARKPLQVSQLLWRCKRAGSNIGVLCNHIYNQQGAVGVRRIQGVLSLAKQYGTVATEDACAVALEMAVHEYQFVRRYLERTPSSACDTSIPSFASSPSIAISSIKELRSQKYECNRTQSCSSPITLGWHGGRAGDPASPGPDRTHASH